jgi:rhodanese-related sulfurtransferase
VDEGDYDLLKLSEIDQSDCEEERTEAVKHVASDVDSDDDDDEFSIKFNKNNLQLDVSTNSTNSANNSLIAVSSSSTTRRCLFKQSQLSRPQPINFDSPRSYNTDTTTTTTTTTITSKHVTKQVTPISCYKNTIISDDEAASLVDFSLQSIEQSLSIKASGRGIETIDEMTEESSGGSSLSSLESFTNVNTTDVRMQQELIMSLLDREDTGKLIGDRSAHHILPCTATNLKHSDLNCITPSTVTQVLDGHYDRLIDRLIIIDSRYPYEFEGGHIRNARNIYTKEKIIDTFLTNRQQLLGGSDASSQQDKRTVIIFHCEFSSERGPGLLRFLRSQDRAANRDAYPKLFYPELYLLEGGYKAFFEDHTVNIIKYLIGLGRFLRFS